MKKSCFIFFIVIGNLFIHLLPVFAQDTVSVDKTSFLFLQISICIVLLLISIIIFIMYYHIEKKEKNSLELSFYPPRKLPIALCSYIQYGNMEQAQLISLFLQWAQYGYLQIVEEEKTLYIIKKLPLPKHAPAYEQTVFTALFQQDSKIRIASSNQQEQKHFWNNLNYIFKKAIENTISHKIYRKTSFFLLTLQAICISIPVFLIVFSALFPFIQQMNQTLFYASLSMLSICVCYILWGVYLQKEQLAKIDFLKYVLAIISSIVILRISKLLLDSKVNILYLVISFSALLLIAIFLLFYKNRTRIGHLYLQDIWKTQNCILHIRYTQIEQQLQQNPQYYYQLLPYAYALQLDDIWKAKFKPYSLPYPHWFSTTDIDVLSQEPLEHIHSCINTLCYYIDPLHKKE